MKIRNLLFSFLSLQASVLTAGGFVDFVKKNLLPADVLSTPIPTIFEENKAQLDALEKELALFAHEDAPFNQAVTLCITQLKEQLSGVQHALKTEPTDEFLNSELALLHEHQQTCKDKLNTRNRIKNLLDEQATLIKGLLNDPALKEYRKELKVEAGKATYTFDDLRAITQLHQEKAKEIESLKAKDHDLQTEIVRTRQSLKNFEKLLKEPAAHIEKAEPIVSTQSAPILTDKQQNIIKALQEQLLNDKIQLLTLTLKELEYKKNSTTLRLFIAQEQFAVLEDLQRSIRQHMEIKEEEVNAAKESLNKKRQQIVAHKDEITQEIDLINQEYKQQEEKTENIRKLYSFSASSELADLSRTIKPTISSYTSFLEYAQARSALKALQLKKEFLEALAQLDDRKLLNEHITSSSKQSMYKIFSEKFDSERALQDEIKIYPLTDLKTESVTLAAKRRTTQEALDRQKQELELLNSIRSAIEEHKSSIFKGNIPAYTHCQELINATTTEIEQQIESITKLIGIYAEAANLVDSTTKQTQFIIDELREGEKWRRPGEAITLSGIKNIGPDIRLFFKEMRAYAKQFSFAALLSAFATNIKTEPAHSLLLAILMLIGIMCLMVLRKLLPYIALGLTKLSGEYSALHGLSLFFATITNWAHRYYWLLVLWLGSVAAIIYSCGQSCPFFMIFYVLSIPYLIYLAYTFVRYLRTANSAYGYLFFEESTQKEIFLIISALLYTTIGLFFFKQAFTLSGNYKSELPRILLASNFIILQLSLIFLIAKELVSIIPTKGTFWQWVHAYVERFYYVILAIIIAIIIMINPYVGFGNLLLYIFLRLIFTLAVLLLLFWIHTALRRFAATFFFHTEEENVRDRFPSARTWYSIFSVVLFLFIVAIGTILIAKIWHWPAMLARINDWASLKKLLDTPLLFAESQRPFTFLSLIEIVGFLFIGFIIAFAINRFVFGRIFDVLMVDAGAQSAISSVTRYTVVIIALIIGFQSVGLGALMWTLIATLAVGISWIMKDMLGDFLAYFIILVQRPIKIGDYIKLDEETFGVVRKITPRAVILRKRGALTLIVPNTQIISKPLINWNYKPGFIVMDDIELLISYKEDPVKIKAILLSALEANPYILKNPKPVVRLNELGEYGFKFIVRGFLSSNYTMDQWDIAGNLRIDLVEALRKNNISIAVPSRIFLMEDEEEKKK